MQTTQMRIHMCILHVCGGDPNQIYAGVKGRMYSPRMWR